MRELNPVLMVLVQCVQSPISAGAADGGGGIHRHPGSGPRPLKGNVRGLAAVATLPPSPLSLARFFSLSLPLFSPSVSLPLSSSFSPSVSLSLSPSLSLSLPLSLSISLSLPLSLSIPLSLSLSLPPPLSLSHLFPLSLISLS